MNDPTLKAIVEEIAPALVGRALGKIFQLARAAIVIDFRTADGRYLLLSVEPSRQRLYLIGRTVRELERQSIAPSPFALALRKHTGGAPLQSLTKDETDRIVRFSFDARDAAGDARERTLVAQMTGRSANLFLLDEEQRIIDSIRAAHGAGQQTGDPYEPPSRTTSADTVEAPSTQTGETTQPSQRIFERGSFASLSEALDDYHHRAEEAHTFDARAAALAARLRQSAEKQRKLRRNLERDLAAHGDAEAHKRVGDLLLANLANAERRGQIVRLTDYFADDAPTIELEVDENRSLQEEAARAFSRYTKARRAAAEISQRLEAITRDLDRLEAERAALQSIIDARDSDALEAFARGEHRGAQTGDTRRARTSSASTGTHAARSASKQKATQTVAGARRYVSSDGFEILVGRGAKDNDYLTFRVARSQDLWLHAADYPGSHVIVRQRARNEEVPHRTVIEAAQLAAHFSQARKDSKVAVHYTPRKFVSKIKGAAPGLVRLSSFRTLLVEPRESIERG
ncbi:MAG TPA: NFACT family protein [Pyrinomonadaceae bacterium]|jgi:predicted ribosome quality control (RQC) complex YloA/Tae2 family protein